MLEHDEFSTRMLLHSQMVSFSPDSQAQNLFNEEKGSLDMDFYYRISPKKVVQRS